MGTLDNQTTTKHMEDEISPNELKVMSLNRMVLHISFTVPTKTISASPLKSSLYNLFTPCVFVLYTLVLTAQILGVYQYWGDLDVTMENLFLTTGFVMCYWEGAYMKIKREQIWKIFDRLDSAPVPTASNSALSEAHKRIIREAQSSCMKLSWFMFLSINVGTLMWAVFPLVNLLVHSLSEDESSDAVPQETACKPWPYLMYIIWVPYDATTIPMYAVTYTVQVIVYFTASLYNTGSNIVFLNLVLHATAKFKIVEYSFLRLGEMLSVNKDEVEEIRGTPECDNGKETLNDEDKYLHSRTSVRVPNNRTLAKDLQLCLDRHYSEIEDFLMECIKQHQDAINFAFQLNYIVSPWIAFALLIHQLLLVAEVFQLVLLQTCQHRVTTSSSLTPISCLMSSTFLISLGLAVLASDITTAGTGFAILKHFMSIIGVLSQSLLLCWFGERLIQQSLRVKAAAYNCNWYDQSTMFQRLLLMVIKRAQNPVKFSAGSFFDINIEKFDHILRRAYSYYAVLRKMKET